ncbi:MAG: acyl-CoA carboxylase subunit epsilon [Microlunatus sp.]|nr:acyl-CoA carboxylase subunit epsilon [Microlunatus sp.]
MSGSHSDDLVDPALRVVRGHPDSEELAALVVVLSLLADGSVTSPAPAPTNGWAAPWRGMRAPLRPGPDAWRMSVRH